MKRKFLSILLTLAMVLTLLPVSAMAADGDVAEVDGTGYSALVNAINAAGTGKTVKLLADINGRTEIQAGKDIVLDLNGKTMSHTGTTLYNSGTLVVKDSSAGKTGKIVSTGNVGICVNHNSTTTIEYAKIEAREGAVITGYATGATITIKDGVFKALDNAVVAGNGNETDEKTERRVNANNITIDGGTFIGNIESPGYIACGIYAPWKDIINVNGGNFTVNNGIGIVARAGQVTVNGGTFTCTGSAKGGVGDKHFDMDAAQAVYFDASNPAYPAYNSKTDYIKLQGGTFSSDVSAYVPNGYIYNSETKTVEPLGATNAVAKVGNTYYKTLPEAVAAAQNGEATTITLLTDVALTNYIYIKDGKNITLDLNGHTITRAGYSVFRVGNAKFHVTGSGSINEAVKDGYAPIIALGSGTDTADYTIITIDKDVTLKGDYAGIFVDTDTSGSYNNYGLVINMKGSIDVKRDGEDSPGSGIYVNGNNKVTTGNVMQINLDGTRINAGNGQGIYAAGYAKWNLKNCTFNAEQAAIELRAGEMTINGGSYTATDVPTTVEPNGNGSTTDGAAIAVCQHTTKLSTSLTINGGTFTGFSALYEKNAQGNSAEDIAKVNLKVAGGRFATSNGGTAAVYSENKTGFITGGLFTSDPSAYVADDHYVDGSNNSDYPYEVKVGPKTGAAIIVTDDTTPTIPDNANLSEVDKSAISSVISKTEVDGVTEAIGDNKATLVGNAANGAEKVEVKVNVKVEVTGADLTSGNKTLTFTATPVATITVTKAGSSTITNDVPVSNAMLNGQPITVKLPLPADFNPEQIKHISSDGSVEYFLKTAKRGANTFEIKDGCAVFTITKLSTFELSGTVTYVEPSY